MLISLKFSLQLYLQFNDCYLDLNIDFFLTFQTKQSDITVHISDVNNNQPVFINSTYHFSVTENEKDREIGNISVSL